MRNVFLVAVVLLSPACKAQRPDEAVVALVREMEHALQTGDSKAWTALFDAKTRENVPVGQQSIPTRPTVQFRATRTLVQGDTAAVIASMTDSAKPAARNHVTLRLVRESGAWKIADQAWSEKAPDPGLIYSTLPPSDGAFARAGSPWQGIARSSRNSKFYNPEQVRWGLQAAVDESYIYIRIENGHELPAPNTEVQGEFPNLKNPASLDWPVMKIRVSGAPRQEPKEFRLDAAESIGDQATFDKQGKANSHRHYMAYLLTVWRGDDRVVSAEAGSNVGPLVQVHGRYMDLRIPLQALGVDQGAKFAILDANGPNGMILPYEVAAYR
jgi:hypothetical protein